MFESLVARDALARIPAAWPKDDPVVLSAAGVGRILGVSRERVSGIARDPVAYGKTWPTFLIPDVVQAVDGGNPFRGWRRDYVKAVAELRGLFPPHSPDRGGLYWGEWVEVLIGRDRTPWFQFYGQTMSREESAIRANVAGVYRAAQELARELAQDLAAPTPADAVPA